MAKMEMKRKGIMFTKHKKNNIDRVSELGYAVKTSEESMELIMALLEIHKERFTRKAKKAIAEWMTSKDIDFILGKCKYCGGVITSELGHVCDIKPMASPMPA